MPPAVPALVTNRLLAALPHHVCPGFLAACEPVELVFAEILAEVGERIRYVYFPTQGYISLTTNPIACRNSLGVILVGDEGMLGSTLVLGVDVALLHAQVQRGGTALRMEAAMFGRKLETSPALRAGLERYLYVVMSQQARNAVCTRFHLVEARLVRWLLMAQDRAHSNDLHITHEFLAHLLGVRRVGVTKAATELQRRRLIRYSRGNITIIDRTGMEAASCGCYAADKAVYAKIMRVRQAAGLGIELPF